MVKLIPKITLLKCYNVPYPTVKMELDERVISSEKERKEYKAYFNTKLKSFQIETLTGESISYASFLTEHLLVVRPIARLGYLPSNQTAWGQLAVASPSQLGLIDFPSSEKLPIYIQHHALRRYEERSFVSAGGGFIMLGHRFAFTENHITVICKNHTLLAYHAGDHKIGYFVVTHHGDKWILRTFLLLTNEGTPEGQKLKELTAINKIDAKYLKIDTMDAFIHYDIGANEKLTAVFTEAGCEPLLEYAKFFDRTNLKVKNADALSKYLFDVPRNDED